MKMWYNACINIKRLRHKGTFKLLVPRSLQQVSVPLCYYTNKDMEYDPKLSSLPKSMAERAIFARYEFIKNPHKSQIDDDVLVWCYCEEDNLWYSLLGNYSHKSPEEKRIQNEEKTTTAKQLAIEMYETVIYTNIIRLDVLKRDNYTCQMCGKKGDTKLHVHHICKRKNNGSDCPSNLITLCPKCHFSADRKEYNPEWT